MLMDLPMREVVFHQRRFGTPWRAPTMFFGEFSPFSLNQVCRKCRGPGPRHTCGRDFHVELGFTGEKTAQAAIYPKALCRAWARAYWMWLRAQASCTSEDLLRTCAVAR